MNKPERLSKSKARNAGLASPDRQQTAEYISTVALQLSEMAEQVHLPFLKYLLDMTTEEAMKQRDMLLRRRVNSPAE